MPIMISISFAGASVLGCHGSSSSPGSRCLSPCSIAEVKPLSGALIAIFMPFPSRKRRKIRAIKASPPPLQCEMPEGETGGAHRAALSWRIRCPAIYPVPDRQASGHGLHGVFRSDAGHTLLANDPLRCSVILTGGRAFAASGRDLQFVARDSRSPAGMTARETTARDPITRTALNCANSELGLGSLLTDLRRTPVDRFGSQQPVTRDGLSSTLK